MAHAGDMSHPSRTRIGRPLLGLLPALTLAGGCAGPLRPDLPSLDPRADLAIFTGEDGRALSWSDFIDALERADVIVVGELHDDALGHRVQRAIVEDAVERWPGTALSMEMLDRSEQAAVDDYLADLIDREQFIERTASTRWRKITRQFLDRKINRRDFAAKIMKIGWPDWLENYQPIIDAAKDAGAPVVAANTPWLRYTSLANKEGYERLDTLTDAQRALFDRPDELPQGKYRERFWDVMVGRAEGEEPEAGEDGEAEEDDEGVHMDLSDEQVLGAFRAQLTMDATMAQSIARARQAGAEKVIHLVGQFHCDFQGGTVLELQRRLPDDRIFVVSLRPGPVDATSLDEDDLDRAQIIIYTGERADDE